MSATRESDLYRRWSDIIAVLQMTSIIQRAAWRAARRPLARYTSNRTPWNSESVGEINTDPEPLENYEYAPPISNQYRSPKGWDDLQMRRNFGEAVSILFFILKKFQSIYFS